MSGKLRRVAPTDRRLVPPPSSSPSPPPLLRSRYTSMPVALRANVSAWLDHCDFLRLAACDRESLRVATLPAASCTHMTLDYRRCDASQGTRLRAQPTSVVMRLDHEQVDVRLAMLAQLPRLCRLRFEMDRLVGMNVRHFRPLKKLATLENYCCAWSGGKSDLCELERTLPSLTSLSFHPSTSPLLAARMFDDADAPTRCDDATAAATAADATSTVAVTSDDASVAETTPSIYTRLLHLDASIAFDTFPTGNRAFRRLASLTSLTLRQSGLVEVEIALEAFSRLVRLSCHDLRMTVDPGSDPVAILLRHPRLPQLRELHLLDCQVLNHRSQAPYLLESIARSAPLLEALSVTVALATGALMAQAERNGTEAIEARIEERRRVGAVAKIDGVDADAVVATTTPTEYERNEMLRWRRNRERYRDNIAANIGGAHTLSGLTHLERLRLEAGRYTFGGGRAVVPCSNGSSAHTPAFAVGRLPQVRELQLSAHYDLSAVVAPLLTQLALTQPLRIGSREVRSAATTTVAASNSGADVACASSSSGSDAVPPVPSAADADAAPDLEFGFARRLPTLATLRLESLQMWPRRSLATLVAHKTLRTVSIGDMRVAVDGIRVDRDLAVDGNGDNAAASVTAKDIAEWRTASPSDRRRALVLSQR